MKRRLTGLLLTGLLGGLATTAAATEGDGERVQVSGEVIDTWCYYSGVMGGPDAVVGSAHHTCAMWCAAGGIPVGVLADDGSVYMVMKWQGDAAIADGEALLDSQSHRISVDGTMFERDGIRYLFVAEVTADEGITNRNHLDYGVVPFFAFPEPSE
ncbi:MAG: hypothetical protein ACFBWO_08080 [Paracoccaceae bacterium]